MQQELILGGRAPTQTSPTLRDVLMVLFGHRKLFVVSFVVVLALVAFYAFTAPRFEASMKILVRKGRLDPPVTPQPSSDPGFARNSVTEEEVNSEAELLRDSDLLRRVAESSGLAASGLLESLHIERPDRRKQIERATRQLAARLVIEPVRKTAVIRVSYRSSDPKKAVSVLECLSREYSLKHAALHRPSGESHFFDQQVEESRKRLDEAESNLLLFTQREGFVQAPFERDAALQKLSDAEVSYRQLRLEMAQAEQKVRTLHIQMVAFPARSTADIRVSDNSQLLEKLKSRLLELQLKRTELLTRYEPSYRLVQEVETQIGETQSAINRELKEPVREETTEKDPNHEWAKAELEKTEVELRGMQARAGYAARELVDARTHARILGAAAIEQEDLQRTAKAAEDAYLLYVRKREEARIGDALDETGILNFTIAQPPLEPVLPLRSGLSFGLIALGAATLCGTGLAFAADYLAPGFRSPEELVACLNAPLLATFPEEAA